MEYIKPQDWIKNYASNNEYQLIDIREPYECIDSKSEAIQIPMEELVEHPELIAKGKKNVIMCNSGKRAAALVNLLETDYHLSKLYVLEGGYTALSEIL